MAAPHDPAARLHPATASLAEPPRRLTILAVDDSPSDLKLLTRTVREVTEWNAEILTCHGAAECLTMLESRSVDVLLMDYHLGEVTGIQLLKEIRQTGTMTVAILLTGRGDERAAVEALQAGASDYLRKDDLSKSTLRKAVDGALEKRSLQFAVSEYRKQLERALANVERRNEEIQAHYRGVTRELTAPLSSALENLTQLLQGQAGPLDAEQSEIVESIWESCGEIAAYLNDVSEVGRVAPGRIALLLRREDLGDLVRRVSGTFAARAEDLGVRVETHIAADLDPAVIDRRRITQVLVNLLENAFEFCPAGSRVEIEVQEDAFDPRFHSVSVTDTGPGIPAAKLERIDAAFSKAESTDATRASQDIGRGLALCQEIVRLHGGRISVESAAGKGTTFSFTLPLAREGDGPDAYEPDAPAKPDLAA